VQRHRLNAYGKMQVLMWTTSVKMRLLFASLSALLVSFIPTTLMAAPYGSGIYGNGLFGQGQVKIGPVTLPLTGPQLEFSLSAILVAFGVAWLVWLYQKKRQQRSS
jgi:hypothetical protein